MTWYVVGMETDGVGNWARQVGEFDSHAQAVAYYALLRASEWWRDVKVPRDHLVCALCASCKLCQLCGECFCG